MHINTSSACNILLLVSCMACAPKKTEIVTAPAPGKQIRLITLDPGHFHAALVQKSMYNTVDSTVHVFAPNGDELSEHLKKIDAYNKRPDSPTRWNEVVYTGSDYLQKLIAGHNGNVVVLAGNNKQKTAYIKACIDARLNVLADKPMAIDAASFRQLKQAFDAATKNQVLLYDIMTERYEITTQLQRAFSMQPNLFGTLLKGSANDPAVTKESVHHFYKTVSGAPLKRPAWFFDVAQEGNGIVDVTTHLVDLVQWECFPEQIIRYDSDIVIDDARRWQTVLTPTQFKRATQLAAYPEYLKKDVVKDTLLSVYANGQINYRIKGVHARVSVTWNFEAPAGAGDTHFSIMKGTKANLIIRQGIEEQYKPVLYIEPARGIDGEAFTTALNEAVASLQATYPGIAAEPAGALWRIAVPGKYHNGHEAHFAQVTEKFLGYVTQRNMPEWEVPNMLAKYYTTTQALEKALDK